MKSSKINIISISATLATVSVYLLLLFYTGIHFFSVDKIEGKRNKKILMLFRNDDLTGYSDPLVEEEVLNLFHHYQIRPLFAVIPDRLNKNDMGEYLKPGENQKIIGKLSEWYGNKKIELAIHGFNHHKRKGSVGEFDGLSYEEQLKFKREQVIESHDFFQCRCGVADIFRCGKIPVEDPGFIIVKKERLF